MKKTLIVFIIVLLSKLSFSNLPENSVVAIDNLDFLNSSFVSDPEHLNKIFENKKVVLLGERFHNDGASIKAITKLVKYLHENLGYNVVLFEQSFSKVNLSLNASNADFEFVKCMHFGMHNQNEIFDEYSDFFKYVFNRSKEKKMIFEGIDIEVNGFTLKYFQSCLQKKGIRFDDNPLWNEFKFLFEKARSSIKITKHEYDRAQILLDLLKSQLGGEVTSDLESLFTNYKNFFTLRLMLI